MMQVTGLASTVQKQPDLCHSVQTHTIRLSQHLHRAFIKQCYSAEYY